MPKIEYLNKTYILSKLTPEQIFCRYMNLPCIDFNKYYTNDLLREDNSKGCSFYIHPLSGILYFNDFAWKHFDCFGYVQEMYGLPFNKAIYKIAIDFNLVSNHSFSTAITSNTIKLLKNVKIKKKKEFKVLVRKWTPRNLKFWTSHIDYITEKDLIEYNIYPIHELVMGDKRIFKTNYKNAYAYLLGNKQFQAYNTEGTFIRDSKFFNTTNKVVGLKILDYSKDYVIITKSYKDWFLMKMCGLNAISILAESLRLSEDHQFTIDGFPNKLTLFDNDTAGKRASIRFKNDYSTIPLLFPKDMEKDFSDNLLTFGLNNIRELIEEVKDYYNIKEL